MLVKGGQLSVTTSCQSLPPYSAVSCFLSMWLQKHYPGFRDYPDVAIVKRLLLYIRLNVPSSDATIQAEELLSVLEAQLKGFWLALQGNNSRSPNAGCLRDRRDTTTSETSFCGGYNGDLNPPKNMGPAVEEPTVPEAGPVFLTLQQPLPKSADTQSPINVAANVPTVR